MKRVYMLAGVLLVVVLGATGIAALLLAASASPDLTAAGPTASPAANVAGASSAAGLSSSVRTQYVYGDRLRPLVEETGGAQTLNIYGPGGQIIAQVAQDGSGGQEARYLLADHLGSTRAALDAHGNPVARFEYGPHGETTVSGTAAAEVRYRYTGHPWDESQGLYETPARGYDPTTGRFLSVDPQRQDASPYVYAGNNPVGYLDPTGGGGVPFFVVSGMGSLRNNRMVRPVAEAIGLQPDQMIHNSSIFHSNKGETTGMSKAVGHPSDVLYGKSGDPKMAFPIGDAMYWLIGSKDPVIVPNQLGRGREAMRRRQSSFAEDIVLSDFSGDWKAHEPILGKLESLGLRDRTTVIKASYVTGQGSRRLDTTSNWATRLEGFQVEGETEDFFKTDFDDYVERRMLMTRSLRSGASQGAVADPLSTSSGTVTQSLENPTSSGTVAGHKHLGTPLEEDVIQSSVRPHLWDPLVD